jgi:hypothetical protein
LGFKNWADLVAAGEAEADSPRWSERSDFSITSRAFEAAQEFDASVCSSPHVLVALLEPPVRGPAYEVLTELGATSEKARGYASAWSQTPKGDRQGATSTPVLNTIMGWASGIAVMYASSVVTDEHVLIALTYGSPGRDAPEVAYLDIDPDDIVAKLKDKGAQVPTVLPPVPPPPRGRWGPQVYYPKDQHHSVIGAVADHQLEGSVGFDFASAWKPGMASAVSEEDIPLEAIIRQAVSDPDTAVASGWQVHDVYADNDVSVWSGRQLRRSIAMDGRLDPCLLIRQPVEGTPQDFDDPEIGCRILDRDPKRPGSQGAALGRPITHE